MKYVTNIERRSRTEGRTEGRAEGRAEALRDAVLEVLETRFGEIPYDLREAVTAVDDLSRLKQWLRLAIQAHYPMTSPFRIHTNEFLRFSGSAVQRFPISALV